MSVARGILNYLDKAEAAQAVEKKKQDEREALVLELGMKYGVGSSPKGKSSEKYLTRSASLA